MDFMNRITANIQQLNKLNNLMGSSHDLAEDRSNTAFNMKQWEIDDEPSHAYLGNYITLKNIHTQQLIDQYEMFFSSEEDYYNYLESFKWRQKDTHIVKTYHYETKERGDFCSSVFSIVVYIYHPKARLSDFRDIPYPDTLYCMMAMLEGYKKIFDKIGKFYLAEEQVCIDEEGQIRVWVNSDLSKNYPEVHSSEHANSQLDEEEQMVEEIFQMVLDNADPTEQPDLKFMDFLDRERKNRKLTFQEGKLIVHDYASYHQQKIPSILEAVLEIFNTGNESENQQPFHPEDLSHGPPPVSQLNNFTLPQTIPQNIVQNNQQIPQNLQGMPIQRSPQVTNIPSSPPPNIPINIPPQPHIIYRPPPFHSPPQPRILSPPPTYPHRTYSPPPPLPVRMPMTQPQYIHRPPINIQNMAPVQPSYAFKSLSPTQSPMPPSPKHNTPPIHYHQAQFPSELFHSSNVNNRENKQKDSPIFGFTSEKKDRNNAAYLKQMSNDDSSAVDEEQVMRDLSQLKKNQEKFQFPNPIKQSSSLSQNPFNPFTESSSLSAFNKKSSVTITNARSPFPEKPITPKKSLYYTLQEQKELDPEIAADLLLYT